MDRRAQVKRFDAVARYRRIAGLPPVEPNRLSAGFTAFAQSPAGVEFLEWLYMQTHGKLLPPDAPESALKEHTGARRLCDQILSLVEEPNVGADAGTGRRPAGR